MNQRPVKTVKKDDVEREKIDDDLRRLCLSMLTLMKRRYPNDWRRMLRELQQEG